MLIYKKKISIFQIFSIKSRQKIFFSIQGYLSIFKKHLIIIMYLGIDMDPVKGAGKVFF